MPKQIQEIKDFLLTARRKDAKSVKIKKNKGNTKFKVPLNARSQKDHLNIEHWDNSLWKPISHTTYRYFLFASRSGAVVTCTLWWFKIARRRRSWSSLCLQDSPSKSSSRRQLWREEDYFEDFQWLFEATFHRLNQDVQLPEICFF